MNAFEMHITRPTQTLVRGVTVVLIPDGGPFTFWPSLLEGVIASQLIEGIPPSDPIIIRSTEIFAALRPR
jgi:hypothetical protein